MKRHNAYTLHPMVIGVIFILLISLPKAIAMGFVFFARDGDKMSLAFGIGSLLTVIGLLWFLFKPARE